MDDMDRYALDSTNAQFLRQTTRRARGLHPEAGRELEIPGKDLTEVRYVGRALKRPGLAEMSLRIQVGRQFPASAGPTDYSGAVLGKFLAKALEESMPELLHRASVLATEEAALGRVAAETQIRRMRERLDALDEKDEEDIPTGW